MKSYSVFLLIIICTCTNYEGSKESTAYDSITIFFDGRSENYYTEETIKITVSDTTDLLKLNELKNSSKPTLFAGRKGNEYTIDLVYTNSNTGDKLLVRILKNIELKPTIVYGAGTIFQSSYRNQELVKYVTSLIKLDTIFEYEESLTQKKYEELMLRKTN